MKRAEEALQDICHKSERKWDGTLYTFSDVRYPEYNGCQVISYLAKGVNKVKWFKRPNKV